jgi:hypothetical protein
LCIHLNQKRCHGNLSNGDGHVEKEDGDPCEQKVIAQLAGLLDNCDPISESVENGDHTESLCDGSEELGGVSLVIGSIKAIELIPKPQETRSKL